MVDFPKFGHNYLMKDQSTVIEQSPYSSQAKITLKFHLRGNTSDPIGLQARIYLTKLPNQMQSHAIIKLYPSKFSVVDTLWTSKSRTKISSEQNHSI